MYYSDGDRLIAVMLGVLRMDVETCITEYLIMAPHIFPVEGLFSRRKGIQLLKAARGHNRFDPLPLEKAVQNLAKRHLQSSEGENAPLRSEPSKMQQKQCKVSV